MPVGSSTSTRSVTQVKNVQGAARLKTVSFICSAGTESERLNVSLSAVAQSVMRGLALMLRAVPRSLPAGDCSAPKALTAATSSVAKSASRLRCALCRVRLVIRGFSGFTRNMLVRATSRPEP